MTEPQVWVLIGVLAAAIVGMIGIVMTSFHRTLTASMARIESRIDALEVKFDARYQILETKIDALDRDIQAISRHVFGTDPR